MIQLWHTISCRFKIFTICVDNLLTECPLKWTIFRHWNDLSKRPYQAFDDFELNCKETTKSTDLSMKVKPGFCSINQIKILLDNCLEIVPPDLGNITEVGKHGISPCRFKVFQKCVKMSVESRCLRVWNVFEDWNKKQAPMDKFDGVEEACLLFEKKEKVKKLRKLNNPMGKSSSLDLKPSFGFVLLSLFFI